VNVSHQIQEKKMTYKSQCFCGTIQNGSDAVEGGLVPSFSHPGGNIAVGTRLSTELVPRTFRDDLATRPQRDCNRLVGESQQRANHDSNATDERARAGLRLLMEQADSVHRRVNDVRMVLGMTTISNATTSTERAGQSWKARLVANLKRWWTAVMTWRAEQAAIDQLAAMNDRELRDIGLSRTEIASAVRSRAVCDRRFSRYY
jgi:uncharacterized protein YjiS (DUF1127 family)